MRIIIECPERILHLEAEYIYADCPFAQLQTSCSLAADHTFRQLRRTLPPYPTLDRRINAVAGTPQTKAQEAAER